MTTMRAAVLVAACSLAGCTNGPTAPSRPKLWNLTGTVRQAGTDSFIHGATVDILDGSNAGRSTTTGGGVYAFLDLQEGHFSVRVRHADYSEMTQTVDLTGTRTLDFTLTRIPRADLVADGNVIHHAQPPAFVTWDFSGEGLNRGDGCASSIAGTIQLLDGAGQEIAGAVQAFTVSGTLTVRPGERFTYRGCCFSTAQLDASRTIRTAFTWQTVACP